MMRVGCKDVLDHFIAVQAMCCRFVVRLCLVRTRTNVVVYRTFVLIKPEFPNLWLWSRRVYSTFAARRSPDQAAAAHDIMPPLLGANPAALFAAARGLHGLLNAPGLCAWALPVLSSKWHSQLRSITTARGLSSAVPEQQQGLEEVFEGLEEASINALEGDVSSVGQTQRAPLAAAMCCMQPSPHPARMGPRRQGSWPSHPAQASSLALGAAAALQRAGAAEAASAAEAWGFVDAEEAAAAAQEPPSEGAVHYRTSVPLWNTIVAHYGQLQQTMPEYTARVDLDTFGSLYVEQVGRRGAACPVFGEEWRTWVDRVTRRRRRASFGSLLRQLD
jgi:hypothetical protein